MHFMSPTRSNSFLWALCFLLILGFAASAGVVLARADTCSYTWRCPSGSWQCAQTMGGWSGTQSQAGVTKAQCEAARVTTPNPSPECTCTSGSGGSSSATPVPGAKISNTGNFQQDLVTNATNLLIVSKTTNPFVSSFMQGAATSFISSMFANNTEQQRQQQLMAQEILRRQQEQQQLLEQQRIAEQQRIDAMFARLNRDLKLEGLPFSLSLKPMNTGEGLQLKSMSSSSPDDLKLKMGDSGGYGIKGLPGIYVGGPAGSQAAESTPGNGTDKGYGIKGLPGIYLNGVQPNQAPALAQAAQTLNGPERTLAQDTALQAAQQNPALTAPSQDQQVQNFQQASQDYQQAVQSSAAASRDYQTAQAQVASDQSAVDVARTQISQVTPTPQQQQAFDQMLTAAKTDEDAAVAARQIFEGADAHLTATRSAAATALANLAPASNSSAALAANSSGVVDLHGAKQAQPALLRQPETAAIPVLPAPAMARTPAAANAAASRSLTQPVHDLGGCLASVAQSAPGRSAPTPEELRNQLDAAKEALRRLIENHEKEDALREQWNDEVDEAVHDAKKQAFDLSVDYLLHNAQIITRTKIFKADAEIEELQKLAASDPSKFASLSHQIAQASANSGNLRHTLQSLKDLKKGVEEQERMRDLREWAQKDPEELQKTEGYLEGAKQLVQAALAEDSVKSALHFTPWVNDAIKWGGSLIDTSYDLTAEYLSSRQLDQLNRNSDRYLQAVNALNKRVHVTVSQLNCYKKDAGATNIVAGIGDTR
jgi:hypothetical protein